MKKSQVIQASLKNQQTKCALYSSLSKPSLACIRRYSLDSSEGEDSRIGGAEGSLESTRWVRLATSTSSRGDAQTEGETRVVVGGTRKCQSSANLNGTSGGSDETDSRRGSAFGSAFGSALTCTEEGFVDGRSEDEAREGLDRFAESGGALCTLDLPGE